MAPGIPLATYRVQLTKDFGFDAATAIVPYLKQLGITHLYASPFLKARAGSTHGYDIIDHTQLNPELGGEPAFLRLSDALKAHDLGLILDFVPNHMGVQFADNAWWLDVLEWGATSPYAGYFDIDWEVLPFRRRPGLLLPVLGTSYGAALDSGQLELRYDAATGSFAAWYFEHCLPITPTRYSEILPVIVQAADAGESEAGRALLAIARKYHGLQRPRRNEAPEMKAAIAAVPGGAEVIAKGLSAYRGGEGRTEQGQQLHLLLERQHYRVADWRLATSEINYRRFFDVNTLAGLRVENAATFQAIHGLVERLIAEDRLQGLRLDHVDGLRDPAGYCQRLRRLIRAARPSGSQPFYLLIEKILGEGEPLPHFAGVHGTTGYDILNTITQVLVDGRGLPALDEVWRQAADASPHFPPVLLEAKRRVVETILTSEFTVLTRLLARIAAGHYSTRDYPADALRAAFELYVLNFPVYRTYLTAGQINDGDRRLIDETIARARAQWPQPDAGIFDFLRDVLTMDLVAGGRTSHSVPRVRRFALKVQQFTGPTMAKSLEDTAFYRYHRLLALNEVGGEPAAQEMPLGHFHALMAQRAREWPHAMTATATHDTKRGEDARPRIAALAELAGDWGDAVGRWKRLNAVHIGEADGQRTPSLAHEYMLYQALLGAWPDGAPDAAFVERMQAYAIKAAREGKLETSWINPRETYENGLTGFIAQILDPARSGEFLDSFTAFARRTTLLGALTSLSQLTLKATLPGVPDFYQGTEMWDCSLVDPDNRRPVDFDARRAVLAEAGGDAGSAALTALDRWQDGRAKLLWTRRLLALRQQMPEVFSDGSYEPLTVTGRDADHVIAFARRAGRKAVVVLACRRFAGLTDGGRRWPDLGALEAEVDLGGLSLLPAGTDSSRVAALLAGFPATVLMATA
jgi:(1->4)-alpha-D-glucan 1-alpha-D-glucosylmutase